MAKRKKLPAPVLSPTPDPSGGTEFAPGTPFGRDADKQEILNTLQSYWSEADQNRKGGLNPRDDKWTENLNLYWGRYDFSQKAAWQAKETMPEVPSYVDRFAAAMKEALVSSPSGFYTVSDPADAEGDLAAAIKRMMDVWLTQVGRNQVGSILDFSAVFEEQMKMGALMATSGVVTWKGDTQYGRVALETVDPRNVWLDHTYRNLYRIRRIEIDRHELMAMARATDGKGRAIYNLDEIEALMTGIMLENKAEQEERSGHGMNIVSSRSPIVLDEYIATVVGSDGRVLADKALMVVANGSYLIRGPEGNPFWHGKDWLQYTPLVVAPLSAYGRSYMEDFGSVAKTFNELTNMLLDAVHTSSLNMYAIVPGMLLNPNQVAEGASPNKLWLLEDGVNSKEFASKLEMGNLSPDALRVWQSMKEELSQAAGINEIGLGQFAPNSRTSATEISATQQSSSALVRSVAQTVETRWLDPTLDLVWKTGMQHVGKGDSAIRRAAGDQMFDTMIARRREFVTRPFTFQARGISQLIDKAQKQRAVLSVLGVIAQSETLLQSFMQKVDPVKLVEKLLEWGGVDITDFQTSDRDRMMQNVVSPLQQAGEGAPTSNGSTDMGGLANLMGIGRGQ